VLAKLKFARLRSSICRPAKDRCASDQWPQERCDTQSGHDPEDYTRCEAHTQRSPKVPPLPRPQGRECLGDLRDRKESMAQGPAVVVLNSVSPVTEGTQLYTG
jgi:hypothetical protein